MIDKPTITKMFEPKPDWLDGDANGSLQCDYSCCSYKTNDTDHLREHNETYHNEEMKSHMVLYMACSGSIKGRNELNDRVSAKWIDCTGGQTAYKDGNLRKLGDELVTASRETGYKIYHVYRMGDPGLGLDFPDWWVEGGIKAGVFEEYQLPNDVKAGLDGDQ